MSLEPTSGDWDQFAANEKLFGVQSDYHEELYTTKLEKGGKGWTEKEKWAEKLAREIETVRVFFLCNDSGVFV